MKTCKVDVQDRATARYGRYVLPQSDTELMWPVAFPETFEAGGKQYTTQAPDSLQADSPRVNIFNEEGERVAYYAAQTTSPTKKVQEFFAHKNPADRYVKGERDIELEHAFLALVEYTKVSYKQYAGGGVDDLIRSGRASSMTNKGQSYAAQVSRDAIEKE